MLRRAMLYLWVFPTSAVGLLVLMLASMCGRVRTQIVDGVLEAHGAPIEKLLRDYTLLAGGASAMTLGHVVIARDAELLDLTRDHERVHVRQCERWGGLFIPAYLLCSGWLRLRGREAYFNNPFEREAYGDAGDDVC
jgi:hypothetical protein